MIGRFAVAALAVLAAPAFAETPAEFYTGKQVTIICGSEAGSGYDAYARLFAQHLNSKLRCGVNYQPRSVGFHVNRRPRSVVFGICQELGWVLFANDRHPLRCAGAQKNERERHLLSSTLPTQPSRRKKR